MRYFLLSDVRQTATIDQFGVFYHRKSQYDSAVLLDGEALLYGSYSGLINRS